MSFLCNVQIKRENNQMFDTADAECYGWLPGCCHAVTKVFLLVVSMLCGCYAVLGVCKVVAY